MFGFGNTWLLVIATVANIITFLMIFLIRNTRNRESEAVQLKLDELIRATRPAQNTLPDIEELSEEDLDRIESRFERLARQARCESGAGQTESIHRRTIKMRRSPQMNQRPAAHLIFRFLTPTLLVGECFSPDCPHPACGHFLPLP